MAAWRPSYDIQSCISKGIWRQGMGSFVRNSYVSTPGRHMPLLVHFCVMLQVSTHRWVVCMLLVVLCYRSVTIGELHMCVYTYIYIYIHILLVVLCFRLWPQPILDTYSSDSWFTEPWNDRAFLRGGLVNLCLVVISARHFFSDWALDRLKTAPSLSQRGLQRPWQKRTWSDSGSTFEHEGCRDRQKVSTVHG